MDDVVVANAAIWDGESEHSFRGDVRISGNRIVAVSRQPGSLGGGDPLVIDGAGHTILPGLVEGHGHLSFPNIATAWDLLNMPPEENMLLTMENAALYLSYGFTSVYSAGAAKLRLDIVARDAIAAKMWHGPRIRACSPTITPTGGLNDERQLHETRMLTSMIADGTDEMIRAVRLAAREGVDNIKLNISGDDAGIPSIASSTTAMLDEEVEAAARIGRALGKSLCAHVRSAESIQMAVRHGFDILYHVDLANEETLDMMEARKDAMIVGPTLGFFHNLKNEGVAVGFDGEKAAYDMERNAHVGRELRKRGIQVIIGGDYGLAWQPHGTNARDIEHLINYCGYTAAEALGAATRIGASAMRMGDELGQIKPGYLADILMIRGDPLADVRLLQDRDNLALIMSDGRLHKAPGPAHQYDRAARDFALAQH